MHLPVRNQIPSISFWHVDVPPFWLSSLILCSKTIVIHPFLFPSFITLIVKIKIITNPKKEWAKVAAKEAKALLESRGHSIVRAGAEVTICIGGDGTILYANHKQRLDGIILGIGSKTSYICQLRDYDWKEHIIPLLEGGKTVSIQTLEATIHDRKFVAINDFVVHASNYRVLVLQVRTNGGGAIDDEPASFESDGLIVSSAIGSAAYAYSAGGEKLFPTARALCIVPICAYNRAFKPQTLDKNVEIEIVPANNCAFISDGILVKYLQKDVSLKIKKGRELIFFEGVGSNG